MMSLSHKARHDLEGDLLEVTKVIVKSQGITDPIEITPMFLSNIELKFASTMLFFYLFFPLIICSFNTEPYI